VRRDVSDRNPCHICALVVRGHRFRQHIKAAAYNLADNTPPNRWRTQDRQVAAVGPTQTSRYVGHPRRSNQPHPPHARPEWPGPVGRVDRQRRPDRAPASEDSHCRPQGPNVNDDDLASVRNGTRAYSRDFRDAVAASHSADKVVEIIKAAYRDWGNPTTLLVSARAALPQHRRPPAGRPQDRIVSSVAPGPAITLTARGTTSSPQ
jgi:hypothetical protein